MGTIRFETLTISDIATWYNKAFFLDFLFRAINYSIEKNWELYMTYDNSCETRGRLIPENILVNAIIDLTHKSNIQEYQYYTKNTNKNWLAYYGNTPWYHTLSYLRDHLEDSINLVLEKNRQGHSAYPSDVNFVGSLCHSAWCLN